ncbi:hypothetical protein N5J43_00840 [Pseudomonas nicosulfuronedens]|uniref:hypothetical protein n=1 Tax=Pseudomonas nicosulfuronedens TaxID=2571105 RepID=UPI002449060E|nr:hypothetical protein [Pseudomonas nicosulfuronedens]MDH1007427.1 hypothetical protein [Pseudomonas nicosulfuronedens]MDH1977473.1 hypothetical protein [Pseudomonas nicosulfuronedens]MDH2029001.1 hypothetical protein [Pseudomonas nicosulfuronedens]
MEEEVTLEHEGETYSASYIQVGDELLTYLPDGSERRTLLRGLKPEHAATTHLRAYISTLKRKL